MVSYKLSPYVHFIESRLISSATQYGVFHALTGEVFEPGQRIRALLFAAKLGHKISFSNEDLDSLGADGKQIRKLIEEEFLVPDGSDCLVAFAEHYVVRPLQNPAVAYRSEKGAMHLVRISMAERAYSPKPYDLPPIIEEEMLPLTAQVFLMADGTRTLKKIYTATGFKTGESGIEEPAFRAVIEFLAKPERQLIKLTRQTEQLDDPHKPFNMVPRNFYHSSRWEGQARDEDSRSLIDFHREGIENADWEFDVIEPTVNHAFRFPNEALSGMDYGARFCLSTLKPEILPLLAKADRLNILEVGGGTGSFARAFLEQARRMYSTFEKQATLNYHILDLAPGLIESQRRRLSNVSPPVVHFQQDATEFDLPGFEFDLIIANEVIADFPTAEVKQHCDGETKPKESRAGIGEQPKLTGDGAPYVEKYGLSIKDAPESFVVNAGVFKFVERAWKHLGPDGALVMSEYGGVSRYPVEAFHLNHAEFSIHFGHAIECARKVGFQCRLATLKDFLNIDDLVPMLNGSNEHIQCLNHVFEKYGTSLQFGLISESDFRSKFQELATRVELSGFSFTPLRNNFHYGPNIDDFMVLILNKPAE